MEMPATINETGREEIRGFLQQYHIDSSINWDDDLLKSWAKEAEFQLREGKPPTIELFWFYSVTDATISLTISDAGVDKS